LLARPVAGLDDALGSIGALCDGLRRQGFRVCALEDLERRRSLALPRASPVGPTLTLGQVLERLTDLGYRWEVAYDELLNIFPDKSVLDSPVSPVRVERKGLWRVLEDDLHIRERGIQLFVEFRQDDGPQVTLAAGPATLREALNALVVQLPGAFWTVSGTAGAYFLSISSV
jgi:hypothetical protein